MKTLIKICSIIFNVVFYSFLLVLIAVLMLFVFGIKPYITMSGSMEPAIHTGSICFVDTKADYGEITEGDIIAYAAPAAGLITHRVISISSEGMETKGDANDVSDGISTTADNFRGKTLFSIPCVGYAVEFLKRPAVIAIALILIAGMLTLSFIDSHSKSFPEH